jgi:ABC-2 type transport system ATP-binding protein
VILTTHYIEEAEEMADRIGVINHGSLMLVEDKTTLMKRLGRKQLIISLLTQLEVLPDSLVSDSVQLTNDGYHIYYTFESKHEETGVSSFLKKLSQNGIEFRDLETKQSSLEEIFVTLVGNRS